MLETPKDTSFCGLWVIKHKSQIKKSKFFCHYLIHGTRMILVKKIFSSNLSFINPQGTHFALKSLKNLQKPKIDLLWSSKNLKIDLMWSKG